MPPSPAWQLPGLAARFGVARRDITPAPGIRMRNWGYGEVYRAEGVHRPLTLTAFAVVAADDTLSVLVACDLGWWRGTADEWGVRKAVADAAQTTPERVLVHLSHTHSAPSICAEDAPLEGGAEVPAFLEGIAAAAGGATRQAVAEARRRQPGSLVWQASSAPVAANRDLPIDGRMLLGFSPDRAGDTTLLVGRATGSAGETIATLVNYACHPTVLGWNNALISPDFVGGLREVVEAETGAPCVFLQGASGDLGARENWDREPSVADRLGRAIGHAAVGALLAMPPAGQGLAFRGVVESGAPLADWAQAPGRWPEQVSAELVAVPVEFTPLPTLEDLATRWSHLSESVRAERLQRAERLRATYGSSRPVHPVWVWRLGDVTLVAHPGEAYSLLQTELRRRFPDRTIVVLNLTNGPGWVYLPPREVYSTDAYQAWQTVLAAGSLEAVIDAVTDELSARPGPMPTPRSSP